jgi:hypothetical protein
METGVRRREQEDLRIPALAPFAILARDPPDRNVSRKRAKYAKQKRRKNSVIPA